MTEEVVVAALAALAVLAALAARVHSFSRVSSSDLRSNLSLKNFKLQKQLESNVLRQQGFDID